MLDDAAGCIPLYNIHVFPLPSGKGSCGALWQTLSNGDLHDRKMSPIHFCVPYLGRVPVYVPVPLRGPCAKVFRDCTE